MNIKEQKKGISLIVLVITIIVMIILAAAIILSLDGSDIIERAKGAQSSNDVATAKEIVSLAKSEWSFERKEGYDTFREYAESKLEEAGFDMDKTYVEDSGRVLFGTAARFVRTGVEIGTEVTGYTLSTASKSKTVDTEGLENTNHPTEPNDETGPQPIIGLRRDDGITWKYFGIDKNGDALIVGSVTTNTPKIILGGTGGYKNGPKTLNIVCDTMYSTNKGKARSIDIDDAKRVLNYTGHECEYYYLVDGKNRTLPKVTTVKEIMKKYAENYEIAGWRVSNDRNELENLLVDAYTMSDTDYDKRHETLVFGNSDFWFASSCMRLYVDDSGGTTNGYAYLQFGVRVGKGYFFTYDAEIDNPEQEQKYIRPVVVLNSDLQISYNGTTATLQ